MGSPNPLFQSLTSRHIFPKVLSVLPQYCPSLGYPSPMGLLWAGEPHNPPSQTSHCTFSNPAKSSKAQKPTHMWGSCALNPPSSWPSQDCCSSLTTIKCINSGHKPEGLNPSSHFLAVLSASPCDVASHLPLCPCFGSLCPCHTGL